MGGHFLDRINSVAKLVTELSLRFTVQDDFLNLHVYLI